MTCVEEKLQLIAEQKANIEQLLRDWIVEVKSSSNIMVVDSSDFYAYCKNYNAKIPKSFMRDVWAKAAKAGTLMKRITPTSRYFKLV